MNYGVAKAGMIGLSNVVAIEGEHEGVKCNVIVPGAVTRMAEGIDISAYPPMGPERVAPVVGWLAHENCSITGEMLVAMAGRVGKAFIAETPGVYHPSWTIDQIGQDMDAIRDPKDLWMLPVVPSGHSDQVAALQARCFGEAGRHEPARFRLPWPAGKAKALRGEREWKFPPHVRL